MTRTDSCLLGYDAQARQSSPYARFFQPALAPLPPHVREALAVGCVAHELLAPIEQAATLQVPGYQPIETGYTRSPDGAVRIAALTRMPGVTPAMWDWWFAWHGSEALRYKLWHPLAHVDVAWDDGRSDLSYYVGRVSNVVEYVGAELVQAQVAFLRPSTLGFDEARLAADGEVAICARLGMTIGGVRLETGYLVHHVRPVEDGAEMRSRFWLAGANVRPRGMPGTFGAMLGRAASALKPVRHEQVTALLVHDAQEMNHLAGILPALYATFGPERRS